MIFVLQSSILLRDHPPRTHCHKVLPLDCLLTPLRSPPSWDPLNCLETGTRSFWTLSPRRLWIHRGFQKLLERVSRQFRRVLEGGGGRGLRDGSSERQGHFVSVPKSSRWAARTPPRVVGVHNITKGCCRGASSVPHKTGDNATKQHGVN